MNHLAKYAAHYQQMISVDQHDACCCECHMILLPLLFIEFLHQTGGGNSFQNQPAA